MRVTTIASRKGGTGKTTTAVNLSVALALEGRRVLLVDLDPTANATFYLGINPQGLTRHINTLFIDRYVKTRDVILSFDYGVDIIPGHLSLTESMAGIKHTQIRIVDNLLQEVKPLYDNIIIDTPPSESMLTVNALAASDNVIIPLQTHPFAMETLKQIMDEIQTIQQNLNIRLYVAGILPTMYQKSAAMPKAIIEQARAIYGDLILPYQVDMRTEHQEAIAFGKPLVLYKPNSQGTEVYKQLASTLIGSL